MSKITPEQAAEEYAFKEYSPVPIRDYVWERRIGKTSFLAGRKHFIEHELRKYLYMASEGEPRPADLGVKFKYTDDEIIKKAKED